MHTTYGPGVDQVVAELIRQVERLEKRWRHLPSRSEEGFPSGGRAVLESLREHGAQTVPQIGRYRGTSRQNIQILVNGLKAEGWVEMAQNPAHKRSELVQLTGKGREVVERMAAKERAFLEEVSAELSAESVKGALGVLQQIEELIGKPAGEKEPTSEPAEPVASLAPPEEPGEDSPGDGLEAEELPVSLL